MCVTIIRVVILALCWKVTLQKKVRADLEAGQSCEGTKRGYCRTGTVCDIDDICRVNLHYSCVGQASNCRNGTVCDSQQNRCKRNPSQPCRLNGECVAGAHCAGTTNTCECHDAYTRLQNGTCVPLEGVVGARCRGGNICNDPQAFCKWGQCQCRSKDGSRRSTDPKDLSCKLGVGEFCDPKRYDQCTSNLVCDPTAFTCLLSMGGMCDGGHKRNCLTGAACDFDHRCKLDLNEDCSGSNSLHCKSNTFCDVLNKCKLGVGAACTVRGVSGEPCPAGGTCFNNSCVCDVRYSSPSGLICEPQQRRYGGECGLDGVCDEGMECEEETGHNVCRCPDGTQPNQRLACDIRQGQAAKSGPGPEEEEINYLAIVLGTMGGCVIVAAFAIVGYQRKEHKTHSRQELLARGKAEIRELWELRAAAEQVQYVPNQIPRDAASAQTPSIQI